MGRVRTVGVIVLLVALGIGVAFFTGVLGTPSAGLEDRGDWGTVSEDRTEVITTVWIDNPNPLGLRVGDSVELSYQLYLNDINLANGEKTGIAVPSGNDTVQISTYIQNRDIPPWWIAFVRNNETIPVRAESSARIGGPVSTTVELPTQEQTVLNDSTPVISSLSEVASGTEGTYTETISGDRLTDRAGLDRTRLVSAGYLPTRDTEATVGYEIRDGWARWGNVTEETTTVYFHLRIHNPGDVPVPAAPSNLGADVEMNGVELFSAQASDPSLQNPGSFSASELLDGRVLKPGETEEAVYVVELNNEKLDDWFRSHVRQEEHTDIRTALQLVFSVGDVEFAVPADSPVAYTCEFQTDILVDDQETGTNCGEIESLDVVDDSGSQSDTTERGSEGGTGPDDETGSGAEPGTDEPTPPTAVAEATPRSGEAPLDVTFDGSGSTAPDTEIVEYAWRFDDGTPPETGQQVSHTFSTEGEYTVELVLTDDDGNTARDTVSIDVAAAPPEGPTAVAEAAPVSGDAPLEVEFDAGGSSDPDGAIVEYIWRFKDGTPPASGETATHTFRTAGEYTVELVIVDTEGNRDTDTVTITVASRVG